MNTLTKIDMVHPQISGWCSLQKAHTLASIILATRPAISLEIGVWYGRSLIPMAIAHESIRQGKVIAVDPWSADASVIGQVNPADKEWWNRQEIHETAYRSFLDFVSTSGVSQYVEVHRKTSDAFDPPVGIGLLSVDGNHGDQSIRDIQRYAPFVDIGGFLVADDLNWSGGAVTRAVGLLPGMGFHELYRVENDKESWAVFQKA